MTGPIDKMHEAILYEKLKGKTVRCQLCAHRCTIAPTKRGICSVRENRNGVLYSLVYGLVIASHVDPIEKKPLFHFLPGSKSFSIATAGCNFRCAFCQNWDISQITKGSTSRIIGQNLPPEEIVKQALATDCHSIAYTYTEPTVFFEYAYDTAKLAKKEGLANIFVTNGYQTSETIAKMKGIIDAANVDLKSFSDDFYRKVCGARLKPVLESIKKIYEAGIFLEITTLVIPGENDSEKELTQIAEFIASVSPDIPWHLSRFHPDYQISNLKQTPLETLKNGYKIGKTAGLNYVYFGNVATETGENTYCPKCKKVAVKRFLYFTGIVGVTEKGKCAHCGKDLNIKLRNGVVFE